MIQTLITNWKTTSIGLSSIFGSIVHLVYQIKQGTANEQSWEFAFGGLIVGLGFLFSGDANKSASKAELHDVKQQIAEVPAAITSGDTRFLSQAIAATKPTEPATPTPTPPPNP